MIHCRTHTAATARIQRRLEKWELEHLRALAAEQAERIEQLEQQLVWAESAADSWRDGHQRLQEHLDDGHHIGLTQRGRLVVVPAIAS